jgi:BirA family biotin operon repressor/biotin-[acetyl-CoA-carboxylase] ligase
VPDPLERDGALEGPARAEAGLAAPLSRVFRHDRVDSTNERAFAALAAGEAREGDVHVAREQTRGRGRLGRAWESPAGEGAYLSYVHLPEPPAPPAPALTQAAGLAVLDLVRGLGVARARLDWPNDVVAGDAKLAGVLIESRGFVPEKPHFVIGIGLNVGPGAGSPELAAARAVTSLALLGVETTPEALVQPLVSRVAERLLQAKERPGELALDYLGGTDLAGVDVDVRLADGLHRGRLAGLDPGRGLLLISECAEWLELAHVQGIERLASP